MTKKIVKCVLLVLMVAGLTFAVSNFLAIKTEAYVIFQKLDTGKDPVTGGNYIRCFGKDGGCCTVSPYPF